MNVCTVIARNYLARARVLAESFKRWHPDGTCVVVLVDDDGTLDFADEPFTVIGIDELGIDGLEEMRSAYTLIELCTAVKPWLLRTMLARHDDGTGVAYLDPDVEVHSRMEELEAALREHAVVLTPHLLTGSLRDGRRPSEPDILLAGVYNLGFVAVSDRLDAHTILDWWAERLATECIVAPDRGYFVDQRWADFFPSLADDVLILRDPAYNVAYWNVADRALERADDGYRVCGRPLRFFHYSGYDPAYRFILSRHQDRVELTSHPALFSLCDRYGLALLEKGHQLVADLPYEHGPVEEPPPAPVVEEPPPPSEEERLAWLAGPSEEAPGLNRYQYDVWTARDDLQGAFPAVHDGDVEGFLLWASVHGHLELDAPPGLLPDPPAPLPAPIAEALPPEPVPPPPLPAPVEPARRPQLLRPDGVNVIGYFQGELGTGEVARQLLGALDAAGVPATAVNVPVPGNRQGHGFLAADPARAPFGINLVCVNADALPGYAAEVGEAFFADRHTIGVWWWETSTFPAAFHSSFDLLDEVWVGSRFVADSLRAVAPVPVVHMPIPIVFPEVPPFAAGEQGWPDAFTFLFSWDYHSVFERKNPLAAVEAYTTAFGPDEGATLILKSINYASDRANHRRLLDAVADRPDVVVIDGYLDGRDKDRLMRSCDCYVSLHRSEGLGLTIAEALYYGRPVIATGYSGSVDLMDDRTAYPVDYRLVPTGPGAGPYAPDGEWADPDVGHAARLMREVFERPDVAARKASRAAQDMRERFSAMAVGEAMRRRVGAIGQGVPSTAPVPVVSPARDAVNGEVRRLVARGGRPDGRSRYGGPGAAARRVVLRAMRPYTAYQRQVNEAVERAIGDACEHADAQAETAAREAAQRELDQAEAYAKLAAQVRRQQRDIERLTQPVVLTDGALTRLPPPEPDPDEHEQRT